MNSRSIVVFALILTFFSVWAQAQSVSIVEPVDGSTVAGPDVTIRWRSENINIQDANGEQVDGIGHYHLILIEGKDGAHGLNAGEPIPRPDNIIHTTNREHTFETLAPGSYTVYVVLGDGQHLPLNPTVEAVVQFDVLTLAFIEPVEDATIWGDQLNVRWLSNGINIDAADGQQTEGTGHYHLILRARDNARLNLNPGEPIEATERMIHITDGEYRFENIRPGPYTLFLVLGDGQHIPADPPVFTTLHFRVEGVNAGSSIQDTPWWLVGLILGAIVGAALLLQSQ